jgi:4-hydroxybenzoyl-CoA reductase subunit beta
MLRLPKFRYVGPKTVEEAARILHGEGPEAMPLAGGTDLFPNMKRRQQTPKVVVGLQGIEALHRVSVGRFGLSLGPMLRLSEVTDQPAVKEAYGALWKSAFQVATPQLRNMGTLGGNLCLDTRCNYYDQSYEWRKAIDFCMKKEGKVCWVAPSSPRCWAVSSTDTAPALIALRAAVTLRSAKGERSVDLDQFYADDGMVYLTKQPDELLVNVSVPDAAGWKSTYWKLRRRGSFDFPTPLPK